MTDAIPILDISEALNRSMGDADFLKMMLEELHRIIPDYVERIQNAMQDNNMDTLGSEAHQFKGAAANLGAKELANAALQLEQIGKKGTNEDAAIAFEHLEKSIAAFNQYFKQIDWEGIQKG